MEKQFGLESFKFVDIKLKDVSLEGFLGFKENSSGLVIFAHGSGSSRFSPRNVLVAKYLMEKNFSVLLFDLLTSHEDMARGMRFDIRFLADRLAAVTDWVLEQKELNDLKLGYFGASTGAAASIISAVEMKDKVSAIVSRGGRPDLADEELSVVNCPTLLIVGESDELVVQLNRDAYKKLNCVKEISLVPRATHLFEEPGTLEEAAELAGNWFATYLA